MVIALSDYESSHNYHSKIVKIDESDYLIQGKVTDQITMYREVDDLLEAEKENLGNLFPEKIEEI